MSSGSADPAGPATRLPVVYVVGSSHSGSTLLALLASRHPEMASVGEAHVKPSIRREGRAAEQRCSCGETIAACPFWKAVFARVARAGLVLDARHWGNDYRFESPLLDRLFTRETSSIPLRRLRRWASRHLPIHRARMRRVDAVNVAFLQAILDESGGRVVLDCTKLPTRLTHLLEVPEIDVRVVWLTRDPRGVAYSARRRGEAFDAAATVWSHDQAAAAHLLAPLPADRRLHLRYEDLCVDPLGSLGRLWSFAGLAPIAPLPEVEPASQHVLGNRMRITARLELRQDEAWRNGLTTAEQERVLAITAPWAARLGYG
ncbi:sulfotransferase [Luteitalea sp. TBR-22]|uniref:sulfotransferase n=1 Tax=Luteitalea sp. TBR-22 TaxID=2802971 RepID=UPI001AF453A0|nr:sulfotransferase [Luteitalea sp. TBR-22]BCS33197.1 sulfotransferase [Luteitalea sp. TBR-22]